MHHFQRASDAKVIDMMMNWQRFDSHLSSDCDPQEWSEHAYVDAEELMRLFDGDDWHALSSEWKTRAECWQHRCADILGDFRTPEATTVLLDIAGQTPYDSVVIRASDSLRVVLGTSRLQVPSSIIDRIKRVHSLSSGMIRKSLEQLLMQLEQ